MGLINCFVEHDCEPGLAHGFDVSHHEPASQPSTETQNENACRLTSCLLTNPSPLHTGLGSRALLSVLASILLWSSIIGTALAAEGDRPPTLLAVHVEDDLAWEGSSLFIDHRSPPTIPLLMPPLLDHEETVQHSKRGIDTDPSVGNSDFTIPEPLDTGLSNNFTTGCATFLNRLRMDNSFRKCRPFSLMLQTSSGFFDAQKSYLRITQTLDATCAVNMSQCRSTMDSFARDLQTSSACKTDLDADTPLVIQALNGLVAYPVAYQASCLRDRDGNYCFANAVSNVSSPTDSYPYYLPVGQDMPPGSRPTCNNCLQDAMAVFAQYGNNVTQPISKTYSTAAQQLSIGCGRSFVNVTAAPLKAAASTTHASFTPTFTLLLMFILYFFR
ncbi:hypothetical protein DE146DRAFT_431952 [Phaeosphaeria sp. MPI-PUGE-AT-0046c]|nr:hypothetical protein DE146DRAFT_431952 [Phaeosphaeria sp. MPI-PUGE-AT-0046c]